MLKPQSVAVRKLAALRSGCSVEELGAIRRSLGPGAFSAYCKGVAVECVRNDELEAAIAYLEIARAEQTE